MIKDVKSYFNAVTSRLSNAFNIQDFDLEEEAQFWALAAEHLSRKKPPTFRDMAGWIDLLFRAPVHLVYVKEGDRLVLFRQHIMSDNLELLYEVIEDEVKSSKNREEVVREFEDRLSNIEQKIRYDEDFKMIGTSSFTIGHCQHIPLFLDDEIWGIYCAGPYVETPESIIPRLSIITRILTNWLHHRYEKLNKLQFKQRTRSQPDDINEDKAALNIEDTARFLLSYVINQSGAMGGMVFQKDDQTAILEQVNIPSELQDEFDEWDGKAADFEQFLNANRDLLQDHHFNEHIIYNSADNSSASLCLFFGDIEQKKLQRSKEFNTQIIASLQALLDVKEENRKFVDQLLQTYYMMLRKAEQRKERTENHTPRVTAFCRRFADKFGLNETETNLLLKTARFHDIGYVSFDSASMDAELQHPLIGKKVLKNLMVEPEVVAGVASHHEWIDGSGSPEGLKSEEIPWTGKIVAIFEFVVQFVESNRGGAAENDDNWKEELIQSLVRRTGKQFDMILVPTAIELIKNMSWQECCNLGTSEDEL